LKIEEKTRKSANFFFIKDKPDDDFKGSAEIGGGKLFSFILYLISVPVNYRKSILAFFLN